MYITDASSFTYNLLIINNIYNIRDELGSAFDNNCNAVTVTLGHSLINLKSSISMKYDIALSYNYSYYSYKNV